MTYHLKDLDKTEMIQNNVLTPPYICDLFHWYTPARILRSASTTSLVPNRHKTIRYGKRLIDTSSAALWNGLPDDIKRANNICHFKKLLKPFVALM